MRVLIVGAGIGGLAAAIALRRRGIEAVPFERTDALKEIGAGIAITANAMKVLDSLGLAEAVRRTGAEPPVYAFRSWQGRMLAKVSASELSEKVGAESVATHRADVQRVLLEGLASAGGAVHLGAECVGFDQSEECVRAYLACGREVRGDVLIGADGLNSTVRKRLLGDGPPGYAGYVAWRAVVTPERSLVPQEGIETWGRGRRFLFAPIGRGRVYWAAVENAPRSAAERGSLTNEKHALLAKFGGWHEPVEDLIRATDERAVLRTAIYDREPLGERWGKGRVSLLGDAAHPMTPDLGQGACQAIEDGAVLTKCLSEGIGDPTSALRRYEALRARRVATIVRGSRRLGRVAQLENPLLCRLRDIMLKATPDVVLLRRVEKIEAYEV